MTQRHYDVIVLGRTLGTLVCATLLARRDFSVLLLGQGYQPPSYSFERFTLKRRAFTLTFGSSPVWKRVLQELAQSPTFRRRLWPLEPMFTLAAEHRRVEISARPERFTQEIDREFPEVRQLVDEFYTRLANANSEVDQAFGRDIVWPPGTIWEKLEAARSTSHLPFSDARDPDDLLTKFPVDHPFRELAMLPAVFATDLDYGLMGLPPVALARLHGSWTRGLYALKRGEDELEEFLLERFEAHGGTCHLDQGVESIVVRGGRARGVQLDTSDEPIGTEAVVSSLSGEAIAELAGGQGIQKRARFDWPELSPTAGRFTVSMVVEKEGLPVPMGQETFLLPPESRYPNPRQPVVHLQRYPAGAFAEPRPSHELLVAEAVIPAEGALTLFEAREAVMNTVRFHLPFLDWHLRIVDSVHDGLPLEDYTTGELRKIDRVHLKQAAPKPELMDVQWSVEPPGLFGLVGEPVRGPIPDTFLVGKTTLPALGQEGELISAWSVARILTKKDRARQRRRRQLWTKIETG